MPAGTSSSIPAARAALVDGLEQLLAGHDVVLAPAAAVAAGALAHGHVLDEPHVQRAIDGQLREREVVLVEAAHGHRVDLHGVEAGRQRGIDSIEGLLQLAAARDLLELLGIERIERDVHARQARLLEVGRHLRQQHAVRGHRYVLDAGRMRDSAHEIHHAEAHERLAARQADAADAHARRHAHRLLDLLDAQDVLVRERLHAFFGHAVDAAEIAAVGERYA